jgi:hypothetical protein
MEKAAGARNDKNCHAKPGTPAVITYADDCVALYHGREQAEVVREGLSTWLKPKGLSFGQDKTVATVAVQSEPAHGFGTNGPGRRPAYGTASGVQRCHRGRGPT